MSAIEDVGTLMRAARLDAGLSLSRMAELTHFSKPYLGQVETGTRTATMDVVDAYERVLGAGMWRKEITHPGLTRIKGEQRLSALVHSIRSGSPDVFSKRPTAHATDVAVGTRMDPDGIRQFRQWMTEGETATLRTNSLSVLAKLPGRENAELVVQVLEEDPKVRRLCLASDISRLTQVDWKTALRVADDLPSHPEPRKLARKAAKEAVDPKDTESRWCGSYMLRHLAPVVGR
nr:helix-turn-helix transcriptional regulator [Actinopolyspora xinjiangensis]